MSSECIAADKSEARQKATRREWAGLAVLALPCLLYSMDLTVLNLAVPHLSADLQPTSAQLLWIIDIYGFLIAGSLITMGTLGDRIGRRRLLLIGATVFGLASLLAAFSTSAAMLIAARALLGIAAATLAPSTLSLLRTMFHDPNQRRFAIGVWIASFSAGGAIGPLVGGLLLAHFWWGSVFLIAVPVMLLLLLLGPILLPEYRDPDAGRLDLASAGLSLAAVLAVIYGIKLLAVEGPAGLGLPAVLISVVIGFVFLRRQRRLAAPLIDLDLFRAPAFSALLAINVVGFFVAFAAFLFIAQYLQLVLGMGPLEAGLWTAPSGLAFVAGSLLTPAIAARLRPGSVMASGFLLAAVGFLLLTWIDAPNQVAVVVTGYVVFSLGLAPVVTMTTDLIITAAPPERAGTASGIAETSTEFGGALGIAVLGSIVTAVYRSVIAGNLPTDIPAEGALAAEDTLGGALAAATRLPGRLGAELIEVAREAFAQAFQVSAVICVIAVLAAALLSITALRRIGDEAGGNPTP